MEGSVSGDDAEFARLVRAALRGSILLPGTHTLRSWGRRERPGLAQGACAGASVGAGGCVGTAQR